jgi:hypothetical protein
MFLDLLPVGVGEVVAPLVRPRPKEAHVSYTLRCGDC